MLVGNPASPLRKALTDSGLGEGLTGFVNASYGFGRPGTDALQQLMYRTRSTVVEAGLSYPVIRTRESYEQLVANERLG